MITLVFWLIRKAIGLRAETADEITGLDRSEHGLYSAYAGFTVMNGGIVEQEDSAPLQQETGAETIPVREVREKTPGNFAAIRIICRPASLEKVKNSLNKIGITGMTVSNVMGYGAQKGKPEYYRGTPLDVTLLPKVQIDIVADPASVDKIITTARKALYTGHIGDGKIFVSDVENIVRIRTGEEGSDALWQSD